MSSMFLDLNESVEDAKTSLEIFARSAMPFMVFALCMMVMLGLFSAIISIDMPTVLSFILGGLFMLLGEWLLIVCINLFARQRKESQIKAYQRDLLRETGDGAS